MNTASILIKTEPTTKKQAQKVASDFGLSLSALINTYLKHVVRTRKIELDLGEEPSPRLVRSMKRAEKHWEEGKGSPIFKTGEEAVKWLEDQGI